jgi:PIN domain nuclease of toxin-antitoxin system
LAAPADLGSAIAASGFTELPITIEHALRTETLPAHHRDPFDRLLIAQAMLENCALVSRDANIQQYSGLSHLSA